ncbi:MAG TPA: hypothetical protein VFQ22_09015 [Longimicrobiales bacterium]|nr:hypothetical protein [Longimicrobiales bacterium]
MTPRLLALAALTIASSCGGRPASRIAGSATASVLPAVAVPCPTGEDDTDLDSISDACELALARGFAPMLRTAEGGCNWDTSVRPARLGGEYLFAAERMAEGTVRIAYLPAYYRDCGWSGVKCWLPFVDCDPHAGDSEIILVDVESSDALRWRVVGVFLSAHCFDGSAPSCRWFRGPELDELALAPGPDGGRHPVVWVAEGRQGNYPSRDACDAGHSSIDTCDRNDVEYAFPIRGTRQNLGSRARPAGSAGGCLDAPALGSGSSMPAADAVECFWRKDTRFGGWQADPSEPGATPYARYLEEIAGF